MSPQEVADIQDILKERIPNIHDETAHRIAWQIYTSVFEPMIKSYEQAHLEGSY